MQCLAATGEYLRALSRQDRSAAVDVATRVLAQRTPVVDVIEQMLAPAQAEVGIREQRDDWSVADEHAATAITELVLGVLALRQPPPEPRAAPICVTTPAGEWHGVAARMVAEALRARRWEVIYLGCDLPGEDLRRFLGRVRPAALLLSCTMSAALPQLARSLDAAADAGVPTIVGGSACGRDARRARAVGATAWAADTATAHALLTRWIDEGVAPPVARRAAITGDYLELVGRRNALLDRLAAGAEAAAATAGARGAGPRTTMRALGADLLDALAASLFVDDPRVFEEYVAWLVEMLAPRGVPADAVRSLVGDLRDGVADLRRAARFTELGASIQAD